MNLLTANIWSYDSGLGPEEIVTGLCICSQLTQIFNQTLAQKKQKNIRGGDAVYSSLQ